MLINISWNQFSEWSCLPTVNLMNLIQQISFYWFIHFTATTFDEVWLSAWMNCLFNALWLYGHWLKCRWQWRKCHWVTIIGWSVLLHEVSVHEVLLDKSGTGLRVIEQSVIWFSVCGWSLIEQSVIGGSGIEWNYMKCHWRECHIIMAMDKCHWMMCHFGNATG